MNKYFTFAFLCLFTFVAQAQDKQYKVGCIGFYNFENLFDTNDDENVEDTEFTPKGGKQWTEELYQEKLNNLGTVVSQLGTELSPDGIALLGVAEIENRGVLEDFVTNEKIKDRNYQIVHYDSKDHRGIDVALLYQPKYFEVTNSKILPLVLKNKDGSERFTRDILLVSGLFDGDPMHVMVNHWPSRRGGEKATAQYRNAGADLCKITADSIMASDPNAKIYIMGDLNDDPTSPSVKNHLAARKSKDSVPTKGFFNPMYKYFKKGIGTLAYRDAWSLFDQIIISKGLVNPQAGGYQYYKTRIFNEKFLVQKSGQFKGYPFRTFVGNEYRGGYSDHFPVYVFVVKEVE